MVYLMEYSPNPTPFIRVVSVERVFDEPELVIPSLPFFLGRIVVW